MKTCSKCGAPKPLSYFHVKRESRDGRNHSCKPCTCAAVQARRNADPAAAREYARAYYEANRRRIYEINHAWTKRNWDRMKPALAEAARRRRATERGGLLHRMKRARRRAREMAAAVGVIDYAAIYQRDGGRCWICWLTVPLERAHFDHVEPLALGGGHTEENIRVACKPCNERKGRSAADGVLIYRIGEEVRRLHVA